MATYSAATIAAMNKQGKALLAAKNKGLYTPPTPTPAKPVTPKPVYTVPSGSANVTGQLNGLPYSYTPPKTTSSRTQTASSPSSGTTNWGNKESTYTVDPGITPPPPTPDPDPNPDVPDTTANDYYADLLANQEEAARIRTQAALEANNAYIPEINTYNDKRLQDAYISKELNRVNLPQQLSSLGYSGGATETSMLGAMTDYENRRGTIEQDRNDAVGKIRQNAAQIEATGNADLADMSAQYYQNMISKAQRDQENALSQSRWQTEFNSDQQSEAYQNQLDMAKLKASYGDYSGLQALGISVNALNDGNGSTPTTKAYSARTASSGSANYETGTQNVNYYSEADRILRQRTVPSSQVALIRAWNTQGKLSDTQAEALLKKYGLI
jgi:hypothetical protein